MSCSPNYSYPWQKEPQEHHTSSGFIISQKRILCNAHGVTDARSIRVRKHGDSKKYTANLQYIGHECDLAILIVDEQSFWEHTKPLQFGKIPVFFFLKKMIAQIRTFFVTKKIACKAEKKK